ncbi:MAG: WG repeat-containing protein, partial [Treponema sp.]|nr:WG repeat-containing protein [Treponema sp.]
MKLIFVFFITIILCSCSECNESTASVQKEPSLEEKLSAYNEDSQFFPAVFAGVESLPDGTQMLLVRTYDKTEPELCLDAYKTVVAPDAPYEDRFIPVQTQDTGLWTFADVCRSGMHIAPAVFEQVHPFKDGLGAVRYNGYWGFIDGSGHLAVQCSFLSVQDFFNDISIVSFLQDGKKWWGGIDKKGCILFSIPDESSSESGIERICDFHEYECAKGVRHNMECMISRDGSILLHNLTLGSIEFQSMKDDCFVFSFGNGTLCVRGVFDEERYSQTGKESSSTLYGAFDRSGKWIVEPVHQSYETVQKIIKDSGSEGTKPFRVRAVQ